MYSAGVRFRIRSAKERQEELSKGSCLETEKVFINERNLSSSSSPDPDVISKRMPRILNQVSLTKEPDLLVDNKMRDAAQGKPDLEGLITKVRGRTEARQAMSNRSKSLDWRGMKAERRKETAASVIMDAVDIEGSLKRQAEGMGTANRPNAVKLASQANNTALQLNVKKDAELPYSSDLGSATQVDPASVRSPTTMLSGSRDWRCAMSNRSNSLDWRGTRREDAKESATLVIRDTVDHESSERKDIPSHPKVIELTSSSNKEPLQLSGSKDSGVSINTEVSSATQGTPVSVRNPATKVRGRTEWRQAMSNRSKSLDWRGKRGEGRNEPQALAFWDTIEFKGRSTRLSESSERKETPNRPCSNELPRSSNRAPLQFSVSKEAESPFSSDMSSATRGNPDSVRSPATNVRGRMEWRQAMSNRSKSLDWRGKRGEGRNESQALVIRDTIDFEGSSIRLSESSERKETPNRPNSNELSRSSIRAPLQFSASKDAELHFSSEMGDGTQGKPSVETSTTKARGRSEWKQAMTNRSKSLDWRGRKTTQIADIKDFTDYKGSSTRDSESSETKQMPNANEPTGLPNGKTFSAVSSSAKMARLPLAIDHTRGGQSLPFRLKEKYNEDNTEDGKSIWRNSGQGIPKPNQTKHRVTSQVYGSNIKEITGDQTKLGKTEKNDDLDASVDNFASAGGCLSSSNALNSNSWVGRTPPSLSNMRPVPYNAEKGGTFPRISSKGVGFNFGPDVLPNGAETASAWSTERPPREESSYLLDRNSKYFERTQTGASEGLGTHSLDRVRYRNCRPAISRVVTTESSYSALNSSSNSNSTKESTKTGGDLLETPSESVRNRIHRFEALVKQNQSPSYMLHSRRAFSLQENSDGEAGANKRYSENPLSLGRGDWYRGHLKEHLFSKSDEVVSNSDPSGLVSIAATANNQEPGAGQLLKRPEKLPADPTYKTRDNVKNGTKITTTKQPMDEPDSSLVSHHKGQNTKDRSANVSQPNLKDYSNYRSDPKAIFQEHSISASNHKPFQISTNSPASTSFKSTSKLPLSPFRDSSASGDLKDICNTLSDKQAAAKVSRWILGNRAGIYNDVENDDDDEDDESTEKGDDSDSGDSSVTITSNMSRTDHPGFSVSLVDLCSLGGLDYPPLDGSRSKDEEYWMSTRTSSMSSDVSALSSVTLLGNEELDRLLDDVRGLGDEALQNYENIHVVVLHKEVGNGLGFTVAGGVDQNKRVTVHRVIPGGLAAQEGSIHKGDYVLSINGTALHSSTHREALHTLRKAKKRGMAVVVVRRGDVAEGHHTSKDGPQTEPGNTGRKVCVTLTKSSLDLGFSLEGGVGSSLGDKPLTVHRLFQGGPVGKVFPGDELLEVEGQSLEGLRRLEAWNLIKRLPLGPVDVVLQRYHQPH